MCFFLTLFSRSKHFFLLYSFRLTHHIVLIILLSAGCETTAPLNTGSSSESQSSKLTAALTKLSLKSASKTASPPYKMPPLPLNESNGSAYSEAQIPGMTLINDTQPTVSSVSLRTHSSKFPVRKFLHTQIPGSWTNLLTYFSFLFSLRSSCFCANFHSSNCIDPI